MARQNRSKRTFSSSRRAITRRSRNELAGGAIAAIEAAGATYDRVTVPGALEIPQALAAAVGAGLIPADAGDARYDGAVALGCVIRGETTHYETVSNESNHWLMDVAIRHGVPVGNGILTVENEAQAMARACGGLESKGADAARAVLSLDRTCAGVRGVGGMTGEVARHRTEVGDRPQRRRVSRPCRRCIRWTWRRRISTM